MQFSQTGLLVSVRSADEARMALSGGADLIDVKEPFNGSLGAASLDVLQAVSDEFAATTLLSAALGELVEFDEHNHSLTSELPAGFSFAKFGLANATTFDWRTQLAARFQDLPVSTQRVVVSYGDWKTCNAPAPQEVIDAAVECNATALLFDTFSKDGSSIFDHSGIDQMKSLLALANEQKLLTVIAGGLTEATLRTAVQLRPNFVAVRGAACASRREGAICEDAVRRLKAIVNAANRNVAARVAT